MSDFAEITYTPTQVVCEHPRLIINPLLPELIAKYHVYYFRGRYYRDSRIHQHYFDFNYKPFSIKRNGITKEDISTCFVVDEVSGETFPIYMEVPCNHCDVCKERKISAFVQRCKLETLVYDNKPWFVTLTYNNKYLPEHGVSVDDAQRFLKRLRINLVRSGFTNKIRYVLVGEYGKPPREVKSGVFTQGYRPHYHCILWNIGAKTHQQYLDLVKIIDKSWQSGFIQHRIINPENDKAFYYTAKYLRKDCHVPDGCQDTFILSSRGHGGIGSHFLDGIAPELRRTLNTSFKFFNKWSNKVEELVFSQYVLNRVFPSWSKSVPSVLRRALADFSLSYSRLLQRDCFNIFFNQIQYLYDKYHSYFAEHCYIATIPLCSVSKEVRYKAGDDVELCNEYSGIIERYYNKINFKEAKEIADKRGFFCSKLFEHVIPPDIASRAYRARRNFGLSYARQVI